jgi:hypothetical protein
MNNVLSIACCAPVRWNVSQKWSLSIVYRSTLPIDDYRILELLAEIVVRSRLENAAVEAMGQDQDQDKDLDLDMDMDMDQDLAEDMGTDMVDL